MIVHERPPDPADSYTLGSIVPEQVPFGPNALVLQVWGSISDDGIGALLEPWPSTDTIHTNPDIYFKTSALLLRSLSYRVQTARRLSHPRIISFSSLTFVLLPPDTIKRDLKPGGGVEHE